MRAIASLKMKAIVGGAVGAFVGGFALGGVVFPHVVQTQTRYVTRSDVTEAGVLVATHHCWSGKAPADMVGKIPGHVVVQTPDGVTRYAGTKLTGKALDQQFAGKDAGLTIFGFCR